MKKLSNVKYWNVDDSMKLKMKSEWLRSKRRTMCRYNSQIEKSIHIESEFYEPMKMMWNEKRIDKMAYWRPC